MTNKSKATRGQKPLSLRVCLAQNQKIKSSIKIWKLLVSKYLES